MVKLKEIRELYDFEPKYTFLQLQQNLPEEFKSLQIKDSRLYKAIKTLTETAYPSQADDHDKRWLDFYLPLKRRDHFILVPLGIVLHHKRFFLAFPHSDVEVLTGNEKNEFYFGLIKQTMRFSEIVKKDAGIVAKAIPYDIRTGRILGKYVMENLLPADKKEEILRMYGDHIKRRKRLRSISLDDYLNTAAICYRAAFGDKTDGLTAEHMYNGWADGRDCGMLEIKDKKSKKDFSSWLYHAWNCGGHPFEIVFSWSDLGIHLIPPSLDKHYFVLKVSNYAYAMHFLEMIKALIHNKIAFKAYPLESVLDYLSGETYFTVNVYSKHSISYTYWDRRLLKHIEWDEPNMLKWKYSRPHFPTKLR